MWLLMDQDLERSKRTAAYLQKQGVQVTIVNHENSMPGRDLNVTLAVFFEGWNQATLDRVKNTWQVNAVLCVAQVQLDRYQSLLEAGYADVIPYPPLPEYLRAWQKETNVQKPYLEQLLAEKKRKQTYTKNDETIAFEQTTGKRRAEVIAVAGAKGGVGKTTIASLLAIELKQQGKRVVLAELDPMGNQAVLHKVERLVTADRFETLPNYLTDAELEQNMVKTPHGFWLIPKGDRPFGLSPDGIARLIHLVGGYADVLLLDCHPGLLVSTVEAMREADRVLAVTTSDRTGWTELPTFLSHAGSKKVELVVNRAKEKGNQVDEIRKFLEQEYSVVGVIQEDRELYERVQQGLSPLGNKVTQQVIRALVSGEKIETKKRWKVW